MLGDLFEALSPFDPVDLLITTGALQLCPENQNHATRIEALGHTAGCLDWAEDKPRISKNRLRQTLNSPPISDSIIKHYEDPTNNFFTEPFLFFGGSYLVFPGILEGGTYI
jgi:hypothetical protein